MYKLRKEKVERSFADSKNNHGYRYAMYKGIEKNQNYTWLICATQNMKNIVTKLTKKPRKDDNNTEILFLFSNYESKNKKNKPHAFSHEVCRQSGLSIAGKFFWFSTEHREKCTHHFRSCACSLYRSFRKVRTVLAT